MESSGKEKNPMRKLLYNLILDSENFPPAIEYRAGEIVDAIISNSDINGPIFVGVNIKDCIFKNCDLSNMRLFENCIIENCHFVRCDLRSIGIGVDQAIFKNCKFEKSDFRTNTIDHALLIDCVFESCNMKGTTFKVEKIVNCIFIGKIVETKFHGNNFRDKLLVNLFKANFDGVEFEKCDLSSVIVPQCDDVVYLDGLIERSIKAAEKAELIRDKETSKIMQRRINKYSSCDNYIFDRKYFEKYDGGRNFWELFFSLMRFPDYEMTEDDLMVKYHI